MTDLAAGGVTVTFTQRFAHWVARFVERTAVIVTIGLPSLVFLAFFIESVSNSETGGIATLLMGILVSGVLFFCFCLFFAAFFVLVEIADNTRRR